MIFTEHGKLYDTDHASCIASGDLLDGTPLHPHRLEVWRTEKGTWFRVWRCQREVCPNGNDLDMHSMRDDSETMHWLEALGAYGAVLEFFHLDTA